MCCEEAEARENSSRFLHTRKIFFCRKEVNVFADTFLLTTRFGYVSLTCEDVIRLPMRHTLLMRTSVSFYHRHRFPAEIISHSVWLYFRFALSFRDVEEMLAMRGVFLAMRRCENAVLSSARPTLTAYAPDLLDPAIDGTWMRYS